MGGRHLLDFGEGGLLPLLQLLLDLAVLGPAFLGLESGGQGLPQFLDEVGHVLFQLPSASGRKTERPRPGDVGEIVHIDPVVGGGPVGGGGAQILKDQIAPSGPLGAQSEQVEAAMMHADGEAHRFHGAILADGLIMAVQVSGGFEGQQGQISAAIQRRWFQGFDRRPFAWAHSSSSIRSMSSSDRPK